MRMDTPQRQRRRRQPSNGTFGLLISGLVIFACASPLQTRCALVMISVAKKRPGGSDVPTGRIFWRLVDAESEVVTTLFREGQCIDSTI